MNNNLDNLENGQNVGQTADKDTAGCEIQPAPDDRTPDEIHEALSGETKLVTDQGLTADQYSVSEPWINSSRISEEEEEELSGIHIDYDMKKEEIIPGMKAFQRKVSFKKNLIYTVILAVLAVLYFVSVLRNPDYTAGMILGGLSVLVIALIWYMPARHIQNTVKAIESEAMTFHIEVSEIGFLILEENGKYLVRYSTPSVSVIELPGSFTVCVSREKVFIIPKRCIAPEALDEVRRRMQQGLGGRFQVQEG